MQAQDVMTTRVVAVAPNTPVTEIAKLLLERQISAVPVVSGDRQLLGIVSEGDLTHGLGQEGAKRSWWLDLLASPQTRAETYLRGHGRLAWDVMTRSVISVTPDTPASRDRAAARGAPDQACTGASGRRARRHRQPCRSASRIRAAAVSRHQR
jgi:CBS domain containing-hemolysin-like protein